MTSKLIKDKLALLPKQPGCYLMKSKSKEVIYVGKAKVLKNRVTSYFVGSHNYKTTKLVAEIVDFEYIVTDSEKEALLLEINLIKDYAPKYNIMFMDSSYYPYIQLTNETDPTLRIVRDANDKKHKYFGPFPDATAARDTHRLLKKIYPLRKCKKIPKKPCLYYQLGQCLGPCINEIDPRTYQDITKQIIRFMHGETKATINQLTTKMELASQQLNFEKAMEYRDLIRSVQHVTSKQHVQFGDLEDRDILGYYCDRGYLSITLFFMRNGKLLSRNIDLVPIDDDYQDQIIKFLVSYYQVNTLPKELLLPRDLDITLLAEILTTKILQPQKMQKAELVKMAIENAKELLDTKFDLMERKEAATIGAIRELGKLLKMERPDRIELFDNSNIQGTYAVAGMVCFVNGTPSKKDYRKYKIKTVTGPDDYASMREVIYRRYYRVLVNNLERPNLIIVDGGKGQIKMAKEVIDSLSLDIRICGLAKDDRHSTAMLLDEHGEEIAIDRKSNLFFLLTRMQDEVHRYAISFHKQVRGKSMVQSTLDSIPGVGIKRRKLLLKQFGSLKKIKEASLDELKKVVNEKVAQSIYDSLHTKE